MFWKIAEFFVRIIYFRRFRAAKRIGKAAELLNEGRPGEALDLLERVGKNIHQSLLPIYAFTRGKILDGLGRTTEAEEAFLLVALADPSNGKADLELAILAGRRCDFDECRQWIERLEEKAIPELEDECAGVRTLLEQCDSGEREREFYARARAMAETPLGKEGRTLGLPPDMGVLEEWIAGSPEDAREKLDEIALLVGQGMVEEGGRWKVSLALDESVVVRADGAEVNPFDLVARRLEP